MPSRNAVTFSGNAVAGFVTQPGDPVLERANRGRMKPRDLRVAQGRRQRHGRHPGRVKDFVRIRVADAAEDVRIGEGALERVILAGQPLGELRHG